MATSTTTVTSIQLPKPAPELLINFPQITVVGTDEFDPDKHLAYKPPAKIFTMEELSLPDDIGVSPIAVSEPFPLFTPEAVQRMRAEVLSKEVMANCQYSSNLAQCQLRGFAAQYVTLPASGVIKTD